METTKKRRKYHADSDGNTGFTFKKYLCNFFQYSYNVANKLLTELN